MLGPVSDWSTKFNNLPKVSDTSWATNLAQAVFDLTTGKLEIASIKTVPATFTFGMAAFQSALLVLAPVTSTALGAANFANAWASAIPTSVMLVTPGASVGLPPTPANIFSVAVTLIDPASITLATAGLISALSAIPASPNADDFASAFRDAFLALTCTTTGMNSVVPTPAPLSNPLAATA